MTIQGGPRGLRHATSDVRSRRRAFRSPAGGPSSSAARSAAAAAAFCSRLLLAASARLLTMPTALTVGGTWAQGPRFVLISEPTPK